MLTPVEAEPAHVLPEGLDVLHVLGLGIGVVEAEVADPAVFLGQAEVQAARLGVTDVHVAVGLRREAGFDPTAVLAAVLVAVDHGADEVTAPGPGAVWSRLQVGRTHYRAPCMIWGGVPRPPLLAGAHGATE